MGRQEDLGVDHGDSIPAAVHGEWQQVDVFRQVLGRIGEQIPLAVNVRKLLERFPIFYLMYASDKHYTLLAREPLLTVLATHTS